MNCLACSNIQDVCGEKKSQVTFDQVKLEAATRYAAEDADLVIRLDEILLPKLEQPLGYHFS